MAGTRARVAQPGHPSQLKQNEPRRYDFPRMVDVLDPQAGAPGKAPHALRREVPEVLRWGHQPPGLAGELCRDRAEVSGRDHEDAVRIEMLGAELERAIWVRQMLEHVQHDDDVLRAEPLERGMLERTMAHVEPG